MFDLKNYNPSLKLILTIVLSLSLTMIYSLRVNLIIIGICFGWLIISKVNLIRFVKVNIFLFIFGFFFFVSLISFTRNTGGVYSVNTHNQAMIVVTKTVVFAYLGMLFSLTTKNIDLLYSLKNQLRVPNVFVYGIFAALNLLSDIKMQLLKNTVAFKVRDKKFSKYSPKTITPLLIKTIYFADFVTLAMTSKRFKPEAQRSDYYDIKLQSYDLVFGFVCLVMLVIMFVVK